TTWPRRASAPMKRLRRSTGRAVSTAPTSAGGRWSRAKRLPRALGHREQQPTLAHAFAQGNQVGVGHREAAIGTAQLALARQEGRVGVVGAVDDDGPFARQIVGILQ